MSRTLLALVLLALPVAAQGETGFLRGKGRVDVATAYSLDLYDDYRLGDPPGPPIDDVERSIASLYVAYGLGEELDLVGNGAYVSTESEAGSGFSDESDLQDASLQLKWRPYQRPLGSGTFALLVLPGVRFPMADYTTFADNALSGLGEGDTVLLGRLVAHYQWGASYAALETGYDHRNGKLDDEIPLNVTLGTTTGRATWKLFYTNILALGDTVSNPLLSDSRDGYVRLGAGSYLRVTDSFGLSMDLRYSDEGENQSTGFSIGTVFRF